MAVISQSLGDCSGSEKEACDVRGKYRRHTANLAPPSTAWGWARPPDVGRKQYILLTENNKQTSVRTGNRTKVTGLQAFPHQSSRPRAKLPATKRTQDDGPEETVEYFWIVICKNHRRHIGHPILLGETDSISDPPRLQGDFKVRCDVCDKESSYRSRDLLRFEAEAPESFLAHPLFADFDSVAITQQTDNTAQSSPQAAPAPSFIQVVRNLLQRSRGSNGIKNSPS